MLSGDESVPTVSLVGTTLGSYVLERELGRGGMGAVYVGVDQLIGKRAAIKVLLPEISSNAALVQRFVNEARAATAVRHPGIVEVFQYGVSEGGRAYIVMEYLDGESLAARLKSHGQLPIPNALAIARQTAMVLAAAHKAGIVHRDLKPDNIFLVPDAEVSGGERVKLLDFGVAKLIDPSSQSQTVTGAILGTPQYMSPEQCEGARVVDHRSDLYSLGCTLFQMLSGRLPFVVGGVGGMIGAHLHMTPPKVRDYNQTVSPTLEAIVDRLLAKSPDDRYQTAEEVATALADPATGAVTRPQPIPETPIAGLRLTQRPTVGSPTRPNSQAVRGASDHPLARPDGSAAGIAPTQVSDARPDTPARVDPPTRDGRPTRQEPAPERKRRGWLLPIVGISIAACAGVTAFVLLRSPEERPETPTAPVATEPPPPAPPPKLTKVQMQVGLLEENAKEGDFGDAADLFADIAKSDDAAARAKADEIKATYHAAAVAAAVPEIDKLRTAHRCDDAKKQAAEVAAAWGPDDALAKASLPCTVAVAATPKIGDGTLPFPQPEPPKPEPVGNLRARRDQLLLDELKAKKYGIVLGMCRQQPPDRPSLFKACLISACMLDRFAAVQMVLAIPTDAVGKNAMNEAMNECTAAGHDPRDIKRRRRPDGRRKAD